MLNRKPDVDPPEQKNDLVPQSTPHGSRSLFVFCILLFKGIFQPFELGGVTRFIPSAVKFWKAGN
jgi:hypothetical protein